MSTASPYSAQSLQIKAKEIVGRLDAELSKFQYANEFERRTGVPKSYVALGLGGLGFLMVFFNLAGQLITSMISFVYPAYASFKAIETADKADDKQWLTYWTVIGFLQTIEYFSDLLLYWFPFYYLFKTLIVLYLALPQFRGAETLYVRFLRPYLLNAQTTVDDQTAKLKEKIQEFASGEANKTD